MKARIVNEFKGLINNVEISDRKNYYSILYILEQIENKFGECYTNEFIKNLNSCVEIAYQKYEYFDYAIFEESIDIESTENFKDLIFNYDGLTYCFNELNENLKSRKYNKKII